MRTQRLHRTAAATLLALCAGTAQAETFDANISADSVRVAVDGPLSRLLSDVKGIYDLGALVGEEEQGGDFNAFHVGAMLQGDAGATQANVTAGVGARVQYLSGEGDADGGGLQLGGRIEVRIPGMERIGFLGYAWYGPEAASFGDVEDVLEYAVSLDYQILRDASVYIGYRKLEVDVGAPRDAEEDGVHGGIRLKF